ncbi:hypothetical protein [Streptomyces spiramyceticus]|uniref:hypothetical protein n=1 Tax=Streptomyces spiramyceticus TaxID=299717 RepID=UPI00237B4B31|nr:hypothetical protein [Streptomyces spiramyceticus]
MPRQKRRKQKGRRHRQVNRTPRPVTRSVTAQAAAVPDTGTAFRSVSEGGIGRPAERTWQQLKSRADTGMSIDELSAVVGYQPATISRHVDGLAAHRLAHQRDGRWYPEPAGAR